MDVFLRLNGYQLNLSDEEAYELTMAVARGEIGKEEITAAIADRLLPLRRSGLPILVDLRGVEPLTSALPRQRSTN